MAWLMAKYGVCKLKYLPYSENLLQDITEMCNRLIEEQNYVEQNEQNLF